jgi:hypothetical protein
MVQTEIKIYATTDVFLCEHCVEDTIVSFGKMAMTRLDTWLSRAVDKAKN